MRSEAELQGKVTGFLKSKEGARVITGTLGFGAIVWEVKLAKGLTIAFSCIPEHQIVSLAQAEGIGLLGKSAEDVGVFTHKISDSAVGFLPCDGVTVYRGGGIFFFGFLGGKRVFLVSVRKVVGLVYGDCAGGVVRRKRGSIELAWCATEGIEVMLP